MTETDLRARELELEYRSFLDDEATDGVYKSKVEFMIKRGETRLIVKINDLRKNFKERARGLLENSAEELTAFQRALKEYVISLDPNYGRSNYEFTIGLNGSFGARHVTPRTLISRFLNNTVCVEGIVSKVSLIKPKIFKSVLYCPATKKTIERRHYDLSSLEYKPTSNIIETKDEDGNLLQLEHGLSIYRDHQTATLQEMPEVTPAGQLPRCVDIIIENDLVDKCKPGDRVQIVGSYRCLPNKQGNFSNCVFRTVVIANYVETLSKEVDMNITPEDVQVINRLSKSRAIFKRLSKSLAPSIHGHEYIKQALLCLLLGGVEKNLPNGTRLRGDINVLLIGDPSVAKSQLLRFVLNCAPRAIPTTGRGSTGVGLTAAVTTDPETGDRRLEAGAMVLGDRGVVCIDEFDKMSDIDRTAIHEVMEQGRVSICKAGIQARLNARCSVLAAANPVNGCYDRYKLPKDNIGMQDSLLSRFDLLFIVLDEHDHEKDTHIAQHVVRNHRYRPPNEMEGEPTVLNTNANFLTTMVDDNQEGGRPDIYEKHNHLLHGNLKPKERIFTIDFLRKYIYLARKVKPQLTEAASLMIGEYYSMLRQGDENIDELAKTLPTTARSLETMIRLATAHAKARLSRQVDSEDAAAAISLIQLSYYQKVLIKPKQLKRKKINSDSEDSETDNDEKTNDTAQGDDHRKKRRVGDGEGVEMADEELEPEPEQMSEADIEKLRDQIPDFKGLLNTLCKEHHGASILDLDVVYKQAQERLSYSDANIKQLIKLLEKDDFFMLDASHLYFL